MIQTHPQQYRMGGMPYYVPPVPAPAAGAASPIRIRHVEWVQSVQDGKNGIQLIAGKPTVIRLYLEGPETPVSAEIAWRHGAGAESYLPALNTAVPGLPDAPPDIFLRHRSNLSVSLNFLLPALATREGRLSFRVARVYSRSGELTFPHPPRFECDFIATAPLRVRAIGLRYRDTDGQSHAPDAVHFAYLRSYLKRAYPVADVEWSQIVVDADFPAPFGETTPVRANAQLAALRNREINSGTDIRTHYYGLVSDANGRNFMRGLAFDIPATPRPDVVASGPAGVPRGYTGDRDLSYADWYGAHELGHTYGRYHPGFPTGKQDSSDLGFPYPNGQIGGPNHDFVGFDVGDQELALPMAVLPGESTHDIMTYAENQWVSAYTYLAIMTRLEAEQTFAMQR